MFLIPICHSAPVILPHNCPPIGVFHSTGLSINNNNNNNINNNNDNNKRAYCN